MALVSLKPSPLPQADRDIELMARWRHCALSGEALKLPVVACDLGRYVCREWEREGGIGVVGGGEVKSYV